MEENSCEMMREMESLLASKTADDHQLMEAAAGHGGLDLSSHLDVFHAVLKQVTHLDSHSHQLPLLFYTQLLSL